MLRPTVGRPICLGIKHPSGAYERIFVTVKTVTGLLMWGALSDDRTGLSFTILLVLASAVILGSESRCTHDHILLSQILDSHNLEGQIPVLVTCQKKKKKVKVKITLRLTVSQSVRVGVEPHLGLMTRYLFLFDSYGLVFEGALSDERTGLSFICDVICQFSSHSI
jgi:hypothetical protein